MGLISSTGFAKEEAWYAVAFLCKLINIKKALRIGSGFYSSSKKLLQLIFNL